MARIRLITHCALIGDIDDTESGLDVNDGALFSWRSAFPNAFLATLPAGHLVALLLDASLENTLIAVH